MADETSTDDSIEIASEPSVDDLPAVIGGGKSPGSVNKMQREAYETALARLEKPAKHTAPPKPAKTNYQPFHW